MMQIGNRQFEVRSDPIEVTSLHRVNPSWRFTDPSGHEHRWYDGDTPAESYHPGAQYTLPTLAVIFDGWGYYPDGSRYRIEHYECRQCGARIEPGYTSDHSRRYIPGPKHYSIDGKSVDEATFMREAEAECRAAGIPWQQARTPETKP